MPQDQTFQQTVNTLIAGSAITLQCDVHQRRAESLDVLQRQVQHAFEAERMRVQRELASAASVREDAMAKLEQRAEAKHRECADAILREVFDTSKPASLASLIREWRREPTRVLTVQITKCWSELDARVQRELGGPVGHHVLAAVFIDDILSAEPGVMVRLALDDYGDAFHVVESLGKFARAVGPQAAQDALAALEQALLVAGRRGVGQTVEPEHVARHALRKANLTDRDLYTARAAFNERLERERLQRLHAAAPPPPPGSYAGPSSGWHLPRSQPSATAAAPSAQLPVVGWGGGF